MYQALYRKYRPQTFDDVVGQQSVTETLKTQLPDRPAEPCLSVYRHARYRQDDLRQNSGQGCQL